MKKESEEEKARIILEHFGIEPVSGFTDSVSRMVRGATSKRPLNAFSGGHIDHWDPATKTGIHRPTAKEALTNMRTHRLKCDLEPFSAVWANLKPFEIRLDDRSYQVGENIILMEWDLSTKTFTGRERMGEIIFILTGGQYGLESGFVAMGIDWL